MTHEQIGTIARACHEANRAWCLFCGDDSQRAYDDAEPWQRESVRRGVAVALAGASPEWQHEAWCKDKTADGWVYGPVKDPVAKTHPCLVSYANLPPEQRAKDGIYIAVVHAFVRAFADISNSYPGVADLLKLYGEEEAAEERSRLYLEASTSCR